MNANGTITARSPRIDDSKDIARARFIDLNSQLKKRSRLGCYARATSTGRPLTPFVYPDFTQEVVLSAWLQYVTLRGYSMSRGEDAIGRQRLPFNEEAEVVQAAILISL